MQVEPVDSRGGSHQAKQLTGREYSSTHQQISGLKLGPPEQDLVFPTASPFHQETCTSFLSSSTRGQTEETRTIIPQPPELVRSQKAVKRNRILSQMKGQDKFLEKQIKR